MTWKELKDTVEFHFKEDCEFDESKIIIKRILVNEDTKHVGVWSLEMSDGFVELEIEPG